jgi:hypothetical protein
VVQQKQGSVRPTIQMKNRVRINEDSLLEKEADVRPAIAWNTGSRNAGSGNAKINVLQLRVSAGPGRGSNVVQRMFQPNDDGDAQQQVPQSQQQQQQAPQDQEQQEQQQAEQERLREKYGIQNTFRRFIDSLSEIDASQANPKDKQELKKNTLLEFHKHLKTLGIPEIINFGQQLREAIDRHESSDTIERAFGEGRLIYRAWHPVGHISKAINIKDDEDGAEWAKELVGADYLNVALRPDRLMKYKAAIRGQKEAAAKAAAETTTSSSAAASAEDDVASSSPASRSSSSSKAMRVRGVRRKKNGRGGGGGAGGGADAGGDQSLRILPAIGAVPSSLLFPRHKNTVFTTRRGTATALLPENLNAGFSAFSETSKALLDKETQEPTRDQTDLRGLAEYMQATVTRPVFFNNGDIQSNTMAYRDKRNAAELHVRKSHSAEGEDSMGENYNPLGESFDKTLIDPLRVNAIFYQTFSKATGPTYGTWNEMVVKYRSKGHTTALDEAITHEVPDLEFNDSILQHLEDSGKFSVEKAEEDAHLRENPINGSDYDQ